MKAHFVLYVADQEASTRFYRAVLDVEPTLNVPGMTEFELSSEAVLGLMPEAGATRLLGKPPITGLMRAELYLIVPDPGEFHARAIAHGATELSPLSPRDWGHIAAYSIDASGNVLAFAAPIE